MRIPVKSILAGGLSSFAFAVLFAIFASKAVRGIYEHWEYLQDRSIFWQFFASGGQQNDILGLTHNLIWLALMISLWWILWKFDIFFRLDSKEESSFENIDIEVPPHFQHSENEDMEEETDEPVLDSRWTRDLRSSGAVHE